MEAILTRANGQRFYSRLLRNWESKTKTVISTLNQPRNDLPEFTFDLALSILRSIGRVRHGTMILPLYFQKHRKILLKPLHRHNSAVCKSSDRPHAIADDCHRIALTHFDSLLENCPMQLSRSRCLVCLASGQARQERQYPPISMRATAIWKRHSFCTCFFRSSKSLLSNSVTRPQRRQVMWTCSRGVLRS